MTAQIPAPRWRAITIVRGLNPLAVALAGRLRRLSGSDINGSRGTVRIGENYTRKNSGYVASPQSFRGMPTRGAAPAGAIRAGLGGGLPGTQAPYPETSPLLAAIAAAQNPPGGKK
jgi:hypothetical protein